MFKVAILGLGNIANKMAETLAKMPETELFAVASRDIDRASAFAEKYGATKFYGSYEKLADDPEVQLIYIATPHSLHAEQAIMCLEKDKNCLLEKSFTANAIQAKSVIDVARQRNLFVGEAIWTRYMPLQHELENLISGGIIGKITSVSANLGYKVDHVPRLILPELAGGALLDLGVYPLNFAAMAIKDEILSIDSTAVLGNGVDLANSFTLRFSDNKIAICHSDMRSNLDLRGMIYGTEGQIEVTNINNPEKLTIITKNGVEERVAPPQLTGFEYQVRSAINAIKMGKNEPLEMPHSETLRMMRVMDSLRKRWGVCYPFES